MATATNPRGKPLIQLGVVVANTRLCDEHYRLTFRLSDMPQAEPGQFVHLCPCDGSIAVRESDERSARAGSDARPDSFLLPMLRRAFSIAGLRGEGGGACVDVIFRVVGKATRWMESLRQGEVLSVMGPLGNRFPIPKRSRNAWLVAGGVGLPPMLWLAEALQRAGTRATAFCGARRANLLPLTFDPTEPPIGDASRPTRSCREFALRDAGVVIATDDGSLGFHGHIGQALERFHVANPIEVETLIVYTCGPERMMRFVADYCLERGIECQVCMERAMACGTGLCQSCVVPIRDDADRDGWRYSLCCTDGPVFEASRILWETPGNVASPLVGGAPAGAASRTRRDATKKRRML